MPPNATWPELAESARALGDSVARLTRSLPPDAPGRFRTACAQMAQRAAQFAEAIDRSGAPDLRDRLLRHDLRAHLALVIGYAELWHKRKAPGTARHQADLDAVARG